MEAKNNNSLLVFPDKNDFMRIPIKSCIDLSDNRKKITCPVNGPYGGLYDNVQPDYYILEQSIKYLISKGRPVILGIKARAESHFDVNSNHPDNIYNYRRYEVTDDFASFASGDNYEGHVDIIDSQGVSYNFWINHDVVVVGYLENRCWDLNENGSCDSDTEDLNGDSRCTPRDCGTTTQVIDGESFDIQNEYDYFVIKNSKGNTDQLMIVKVPSSFDTVRDIGSTQRIMHSFSMAWSDEESSYKYLDYPTTHAFIIDDMNFGKIDSVADRLNPSYVMNNNYMLSDNDGDGIIDLMDNCPNDFNSNQADQDDDEVGDACDNCIIISNSDQIDSDGDHMGNVCDNCPELYNKSQLDNDRDGVGNVCDNCPSVPNPNQEDSENNGQGDGVGDACDNCPDNYNPIDSYSLKSEFISGEFGAIANQLGQLDFEVELKDGSAGFVLRYVYKIQPDSDLDGIGDSCDYNSASGNGNGFANSRITNIKPQPPSIRNPMLFERIYSQYTKINLTMPSGSGRESGYCSDNNVPGIPGMPGTGMYRGSICNAAVHYCAVKHNQKHLWGTRGFCTLAGDSSNFFQYGFSHGSDNFDRNSILSWQSRISVADSSANTGFSKWPDFTGSDNPNDDPARKKVTVGNSVFSVVGSENSTIWNWRRDWYEENYCLDNPSLSICENLRTAGDYNESYTMYYALSTSILPITSTAQVIPEYLADNGNAINPDYFPATNLNINARAARYPTYSSRPLELNYYRKPTWPIPPVPETIEIPETIHAPDYYWNISLEDIFDEEGIPEASSTNHIGRWFLGKDENGSYQMSSQQLYFLEEMMFCFEMTEHEMVAVKTVGLPATGVTEYQLLLNTSESGAAWEFLGIINNWDSEMTSIKTVISTDTGLYFIAGTDSQGQYGQYLFMLTVDGSPEITSPENLPEITYSLQNLGLTGIGDDTLKYEKLVSIAGNLFVIGADSAGAGTRVFKLTDDAILFEEITGSAPVGRKIYNLKVSGKYIFLIGGMDDNNGSMTDMWRFDTANEIWEQIPVTLQGDFRKVISQVVDGKLVMANPVIDGNVTHPAFEIDPAIENINDLAENLNYVEIPVTEVEYEALDTYCLNEADQFLKGGLDVSGECVPFTHKWYRSFPAGNTVYSVAGKGDRLYVGTDGLITVYDISDSAAMTYVVEYSAGGERVYDLEVAGNEMYAATSGGIYRFDVSDPDTITLINSYYAGYNYQYRIQLYNDLLYVGDDYGINIRDKETFALISYVDDGAILDFTISDGEIALYSSAFLSSNVQIRDVDSLNLKAWEYADCYTGELTSDHGEFYLSCDGYDYRFEIGSGTYLDFYTLEADILELQENYVYNGWTYIPDGSSIKLSTNNNVPSLCGNGIVEDGEVCDGNSVACTSIDPNYYGGTAYCNSKCDSYNEDSCETNDGW